MSDPSNRIPSKNHENASGELCMCNTPTHFNNANTPPFNLLSSLDSVEELCDIHSQSQPEYTFFVRVSEWKVAIQSDRYIPSPPHLLHATLINPEYGTIKKTYVVGDKIYEKSYGDDLALIFDDLLRLTADEAYRRPWTTGDINWSSPIPE